MPDPPTFGRYAEIPYDQMTPEQQEGYRVLKEVRGQVGGPSKIWVHNPKLAKAAAPLGAHFHPGHYSLTEREREIAVCIINSKWHSAYPTSAHERRGKEVGLPADKVEALLSGLPTSFSDEREQVVYEIATALTNSRWVPKGLYDRAVKAFGHVGITDAITLMGYYTSVSMTLAFYDCRPGHRACPAKRHQADMGVAASFGLSLLGLFVLPVLVSGCLADGRGGVPWYEARRDPTGQAPDTATTQEAVVQVYAARAVSWRGVFSVHTWIAVEPTRAERYTRYEVLGFGVANGAPAVRVDRTGPDN
jgi:4-carboxymuconolactone decarboxylase